MATLANCIVTESLEDGPAFAMREDNDEQVYIPAQIAGKHELTQFDRIQCLLVTNTVKPDKTPWTAHTLKVIQPAT